MPIPRAQAIGKIVNDLHSLDVRPGKSLLEDLHALVPARMDAILTSGDVAPGEKKNSNLMDVLILAGKLLLGVTVTAEGLSCQWFQLPSIQTIDVEALSHVVQMTVYADPGISWSVRVSRADADLPVLFEILSHVGNRLAE